MSAVPTSLTPEQLEQHKNKQQQAEDIAYTLNHAFVCTLTDWVDPFIGNWTQKQFGKKVSVGCGHDHGAGGGHHDEHHHHGHGGGIKSWVIGEFIGDFGAVPATIAVQRLFPGAMHGMRQGLEAVLGPQFHDGARKAGIDWAYRHNLPTDSQQVRDKVAQIYESEVSHLPQALMWTVSAIGINLASQKWLLGNKGSWGELLAAKGLGSTITAGLVVGGRTLAPYSAEKLDRWTSTHVIAPVTGFTSQLLGVDHAGMARAQKRLGMHDDHAVPTNTVNVAEVKEIHPVQPSVALAK